MKNHYGISFSIVLAVVLGVGAVLLFFQSPNEEVILEPAIVDRGLPICDENGNVYASEAVAAESGLIPAQYGATYCDIPAEYTDGAITVAVVFHIADETVSFTHPTSGTFTLPIAVSASGARYTNADESIVFWEHQGEVTITKNNEEIFRGHSSDTPESDPQILSETEAKLIAEHSCVKGGEVLTAGTYNSNSKTWWFDANLNSVREGCTPACVVNEETKTAEINWRCTGLVVPD